jgi:hypothetical protein
MKLYYLSMACINASILVAVCYSMDAMNATDETLRGQRLCEGRR